MRIFRAISIALAALFAATVHAHEGERLGKVAFKVDCTSAAQTEFNVAMAYYHSFAWTLVPRSLNRVLELDPNCGMAYWLRALSLLDNPFTWPVGLTPQRLGEGAGALEQARKAGLKTQRERDYVDALAAFFKDHDKLNHRTRALAYESAMDGLQKRYADDIEAKILHALILTVNFDPTDQKFTNQLRAANILEPVFMQLPEHPGVAHYLIHSYDFPPIAPHGIRAAQRYSKIAPDAAHALHMPSHIFTRVGYWQDSIEANIQSAKIAGPSSYDADHAYDYMVYAHLQLGQEHAARRVIDTAQRQKTVDHFASAYAYAAMAARFVLERGAWAEAAQLSLVPAVENYPWKKYPQAESLNALARGIGAAMTGNAEAAAREVARLQTLRDAAAAAKFMYWVEQIDIQAEMVKGLAATNAAEGLGILGKAADREDKTLKHAVMPGLPVPAREVYADALARAGRHADALAAYEIVMERDPNRYRTYAGAARSAQAAGDSKKASRYHAKVLELAANADVARPEIAAARRYHGMQ